jgi:hypothetical protein
MKRKLTKLERTGMVSRPFRVSRGAAKDWNGKRGEVKESRQEKYQEEEEKGLGKGDIYKRPRRTML